MARTKVTGAGSKGGIVEPGTTYTTKSPTPVVATTSGDFLSSITAKYDNLIAENANYSIQGTDVGDNAVQATYIENDLGTGIAGYVLIYAAGKYYLSDRFAGRGKPHAATAINNVANLNKDADDFNAAVVKAKGNLGDFTIFFKGKLIKEGETLEEVKIKKNTHVSGVGAVLNENEKDDFYNWCVRANNLINALEQKKEHGKGTIKGEKVDDKHYVFDFGQISTCSLIGIDDHNKERHLSRRAQKLIKKGLYKEFLEKAEDAGKAYNAALDAYGRASGDEKKKLGKELRKKKYQYQRLGGEINTQQVQIHLTKDEKGKNHYYLQIGGGDVKVDKETGEVVASKNAQGFPKVYEVASFARPSFFRGPVARVNLPGANTAEIPNNLIVFNPNNEEIKAFVDAVAKGEIDLDKFNLASTKKSADAEKSKVKKAAAKTEEVSKDGVSEKNATIKPILKLKKKVLKISGRVKKVAATIGALIMIAGAAVGAYFGLDKAKEKQDEPEGGKDSVDKVQSLNDLNNTLESITRVDNFKISDVMFDSGSNKMTIYGLGSNGNLFKYVYDTPSGTNFSEIANDLSKLEDLIKNPATKETSREEYTNIKYLTDSGYATEEVNRIYDAMSNTLSKDKCNCEGGIYYKVGSGKDAGDSVIRQCDIIAVGVDPNGGTIYTEFSDDVHNDVGVVKAVSAADVFVTAVQDITNGSVVSKNSSLYTLAGKTPGKEVDVPDMSFDYDFVVDEPTNEGPTLSR